MSFFFLVIAQTIIFSVFSSRSNSRITLSATLKVFVIFVFSVFYDHSSLQTGL